MTDHTSPDRAAAFREAYDIAHQEANRLEEAAGIEPARGARCVAHLLRKRAAPGLTAAQFAATLAVPAGGSDQRRQQYARAIDACRTLTPDALAAAVMAVADAEQAAFTDACRQLAIALGEQQGRAERERNEARAALSSIRDAAQLHRQNLLSTAELYAVIGPATRQ